MKPQFDHLLRASFFMFFDHTLLDKGQTFDNIDSGNLYLTFDPRRDSMDTWAGNLRQWVTDSSISGATIASGVNYSGSFYNRNSGIAIDYANGRILASSGRFSQSGGPVSTAFAAKQINVYTSSETDEQIIFDKPYIFLSGIPIFEQSNGLPSDIRPYPSVYINYYPGLNVPYEFGVISNLKCKMRAIILADSDYMLDGVMGICRDMNKKHFLILDANKLPYTSKGDLKSGIYNYNTLVNNLVGADPMRIAYISNVSTSKMSNEANKAVNKSVLVGIADFNLEIIRNPYN